MYDVASIHGMDIFAQNAAITVCESGAGVVHWIWKNLPAYEQTAPRIKHMPTYQWTRKENRSIATKLGAPTVLFDDKEKREAWCRNTAGTAMVRIAYHLGYRTCFLLGMDCAASSDGKPYAKQLMYARCIYEDRQNEYYANWLGDWKLLRDELWDMTIVQCSPIWPSDMFPRMEFRRAVCISSRQYQ